MDCTNKDPQNVGFNCRKEGFYVLTLFGIEVFPGTFLKLTESTAQMLYLQVPNKFGLPQKSLTCCTKQSIKLNEQEYLH